MKNYFLIALAALFIIAACTKDSVEADQVLGNLPVDSRDDGQITICHKHGNGEYSALTINANALQGHLNHGDYLPDADGDGYSAVGACTGTMNDCDDNNAAINPGAQEVCDGVDNDCDGQVDEGVQTTYYADADGDGYGNANVSQQACSAPQGYVANSTDCNDSQAGVNPGAQEVCGNGVDDDCDGNVDEDCCSYPCFDAGVLNSGTDFYYYLNTEIADCGGWNNLAYVYCPQFEAYAWAFDPSYQVIVFYSILDNSSCVAFVGEGEGYISQAEFDCTMALLRSFIAAHPEIPNGCNPYNGNDPNARVIPENLKKLLPENLRNSLQKQ